MRFPARRRPEAGSKSSTGSMIAVVRVAASVTVWLQVDVAAWKNDCTFADMAVTSVPARLV